jgi:hypothetical protein
MSKPIPSRVRIGLFSLVAVVGVGLILGGHSYLELTATVEAPGLEAPDNLDARELLRKVKLFDAAWHSARRGFIRLSEVEINSYLQELTPATDGSSAGAAAASGARPVRCRADLTADGVIFYSWVEWHWGRHTWDLCWRRHAVLRHVPGHWEFAVDSMRVGELKIPPGYWSKVDAILGAADKPFAARYAWLMKVPALEVEPNGLTHQPELRLYTFADTAALSRAQR